VCRKGRRLELVPDHNELVGIGALVAARKTAAASARADGASVSPHTKMLAVRPAGKRSEGANLRVFKYFIVDFPGAPKWNA
jgi:hypothetical protein